MENGGVKITKDALYREIKRRIIFLEYLPGQDLVMKKLATEFHVSITPIREVLVRLEAERLVRLTPNKGACVTEVSLQDLKDILELRLLLVGTAGRWAAQRITEEELRTMELLLEELKRTKSKDRLIQLDFKFHDLVNQAAKNRELTQVLENLRSQVVRLWTFIGPIASEEYAQRIKHDFERLLSALQKRDSILAENILRDHVISFAELVQVSLMNLDPLHPREEVIGGNPNSA